MNLGRGLLIHAGLFVLASAGAARMWMRDEQPKALVQTEATVWSGRTADVERIVFDGKLKKVTLETKKDDTGAYYIGTLDRGAPVAPPAASAGAPPPPTPPKAGKTEFVAVGAAQKIVDAMAPLKALRALGRIAEDRSSEFGLAEPDGTLIVTLKGTEHKLLIGGTTPGGGDRYVRDPGSGETYVIDGEAVRDLDTAESRLVERDLHEWKEAEVTSADLKAGDKTRKIVRGGPDGKRFWADPVAADQKDETIANWMSKLDRLRPMDYVMTTPADKQDIVRVDYMAGTRKLGFVEVARIPSGDPAGKPEYIVRTERTRLFAKVPATTAEQFEQDVSSILK
jgi:hypothetical protein